MTTTEGTPTASRTRIFPASQFTDHMVERGYVHRGSNGEGGDVLEFYPGNEIVRVHTFAEGRDDDAWAVVFVLTAAEVLRYSAEFTPGTPPAVMLAALVAAETEAAAHR